MATFYVEKVRKEYAGKDDDRHEHIIGVLVGDGTYYTNAEVETSLNAGNVWYTYVPKEPSATIQVKSYCPQWVCYHKPYLTTEADHTTKNNLENLPRG